MKPLALRPVVIVIMLAISHSMFAQKEFFRSNQVFTEDQKEKLYSSILVSDSMVLFNAVDYKLYAYNKNDGALKWSYETKFKTNQPVFMHNNEVYAGIYSGNEEWTATLDARTGKLIKIFPFGPLSSKPLISNGKLYGTAIYEFGCIIAYDLQKDTMAWSLFIAHGYEAQPYYFTDRIIANAEGSRWVELGYDGSFLDSSCLKKDDPVPEPLPCIKRFNVLTHDRQEIKEKAAEKIFGEVFYRRIPVLTTDKLTFAIYDDKLTVIGNKMKVKQQVDIMAMADDLPVTGRTKLLKADDRFVWILYANRLLQYDHQQKKLAKLFDLSAWDPYAIEFDKENIWLVSGKDGLLYGLSL